MYLGGGGGEGTGHPLLHGTTYNYYIENRPCLMDDICCVQQPFANNVGTISPVPGENRDFSNPPSFYASGESLNDQRINVMNYIE